MDSAVFPTFSPQPIVSETPKISKGSSSSSKLQVFYKPPISKPRNYSRLKLRAAAADDAKPIKLDLNYDPIMDLEGILKAAEDQSFFVYRESSTALSPCYEKTPLHVAMVEIVGNEESEIKVLKFQKWLPGGKWETYNSGITRRLRPGQTIKVTWSQVETGSAITCKQPSVVLEGDDSVAEF